MLDTPLMGVYRTAQHHPFFEPHVPTYLKIGGRHTRSPLSKLPLPPTLPPNPTNKFSLTVVSRFGVFTWDKTDFIVVFSDWTSDITEADIRLFIGATEGALPYTLSLCPRTIEVKHTFVHNALTQISALFTQQTKKWLTSTHPPHIANGFIDRTLSVTHRSITPSHFQLWMKA